MQRKIGSLFIVIGIVLVVFIVYAKIETKVEQDKLVDEFSSLTFEDKLAGTQKNPKSIQAGDVIGMLSIPAIELESPVVEGASQENIRYAVGHLPSSSAIETLGQESHNIAIAGHRTNTYGQFFNRLDELNKRDKIILTTKENDYTYEVFETKIVKPTDVDVVKPIEEKSVITLITCHPKNSNKQRLIVYGELMK